MSDQTVVGRPPSSEEQFWLGQVGALSPEKSLERLDTYAKFLFGLVSLLGTLLAGAGIVGTTALPHRAWMLMPLLLLCGSLGTALFGLDPRYGRVRFSRPEEVRDYLNDLVKRRARWVYLAGLLFALAILATGGAVALASWSQPPAATISLKVTASPVAGGAMTVVLGMKADVAGVRSGSIARTTVTGYATPTDLTHGDTLYVAEDNIADDGKVNLALDVNQVEKYHHFVARCTVSRGSETTVDTTTSLSRQ